MTLILARKRFGDGLFSAPYLPPLKPLLPGPDLEVILDDPEVHLAVTGHGEKGPGRDLREFAVVLES